MVKNIPNLTTKKIFLVRHGETDYNRRKVVQGSGIDAPLNELGRAQAQAFHQAYGQQGFDKVYTSVLQRSIQSVQGFIDSGLPWEKHAGLNEINWGSKEGLPFSDQDQQYFLEVTQRWRDGETDLAIAGGESPLQVYNRLKVVLKSILAQTDEREILICMHGRAIRIFLCLLLNYDLSKMDTFDHRNLGLYVLSYTGSMFRVETYNDGSHLDSISLAR